MESYGVWKQMAAENHYVSLAKSLSSAVCTEETRKTLKRITKKSILYAHMGQLVIHEGVCYSTFIQNTGNDGEDHDSSTSGVVLAVFALERARADDFDPEKDVEVYPIGGKGDCCAGHRAMSIFKDNSMCLVGEKLYVCFSFVAEDGKSLIFRKVFDINKQVWTADEAMAVLRYKGQDYDFSDASLNIVYRDKGLAPRAKGLIELVSAWSEYRGEYYATGVTIEGPNNGFIVKTSDFETMTLVDVVPFNDMGTAEIASYVYKGKLFVACRQDYGIPYLYLGFMDLETLEWKQHYRIPDGNSRPWFFEYQGDLYLWNTVEEYCRRYANISRVRVGETPYAFFNDRIPIETLATLKDCGSYYATAEYEGEIYYVCTRETESFGKLNLHFCEPDQVNRKLLEILG